MKKISLFILLVLLSCKQNLHDKEMIAVDELVGNKFHYKNKKALILIPLNGCGTCTKEIIEFSKKNFNNNKFLFILTGVTSQNILEYRKIKNFEDYFVIDENSELVSQGIVENKPILFYVKDGLFTNKIIFDNLNVKNIISKINLL